MEADRRHTTTGVEDLKSRRQSGLDLAQLVVHCDPQALERSCRDMDVARPGLALNRRLDGGGQVACGAERAPRHDGLCDSACPAVLAIFAEDTLVLCGAELINA